MSKKISQLSLATDVTAADLLQVVDIEDGAMAQSGTNKKVTANILAQDLGKLMSITATGSTQARKITDRFADVVNVKDFGAVGDGVTDDTVKIQAAINAGKGPVYFPPGVYIVTNEIVIPDKGGIIGSGAHWRRRTGYAYDGSAQTVFKYTGTGGANTCVIRFSAEAVGVQGDDFSGPDTDDLVNIIAKDFHIDANNLAEIGCYMYRCGNQATVENITAEKAKKYCHVHIGCFAAEFGTFGAYQSEEHGVACGWNVFDWASIEYTNFAYKARFLTANNGTNNTYVKGGATDLDGSGGKFAIGRGSRVYITSEGNNGRACILTQANVTGGASGTTDYILEYLEGNGDGPYVDYRTSSDSIRLMNGFIHPGNGSTLLPQDIKIESKGDSGTVTSNAGPPNPGEWLKLKDLHGDLSGTGFSVDSNTYRFSVVNCSPFIQYPSTHPGALQVNFNLEGTSVAGSPTYSSRTGYIVKNGNLVFFSVRIVLSAKDLATSGRLKITGLPYRAGLFTGHFTNITANNWNNFTTSIVGISGILSGGNTYIDLYKLTAANTSSVTDLVNADLADNSLIQICGTYITDE